MRTAEPVAFARLLKHYRVLAGLWTAPLIPDQVASQPSLVR